MIWRSLAALMLIFAVVGLLEVRHAEAADEKPSDSGKSAEAPAADPQAEFDQIFTQWKEALKALRTIQLEFREASEDKKEESRAQFDKQLEDAKTLVPRLKQAAEKAYVAAPEKNSAVERFLISVLSEDLMNDAHEESYRLAKVLVDHGCSEPRVSLMGGLSAAMIGQLDFADKHLRIAEKAGMLKEPKEQASDIAKQIVSVAQRALAEIDVSRSLWEEEQKIRAMEAKADDLPRVKLQTEAGDIVLELYENEAPNTVANFISLVEKGFYDGLKFHRVIPLFMVQGGCPLGNGTGDPGYFIAAECMKPDYRRHFRGTLSMAVSARSPDTGGSQFFITLVATPHLDGKHTAFGRVIEGLDVLSKIERVAPNNLGQIPPDAHPTHIIKATVLRKRDHAYVPKTLPKL